MTIVAVSAALLAAACGGMDNKQDKMSAERLRRFYEGTPLVHFRLPDGDVAVPFDLGIGHSLRGELPDEFDDPKRLAEFHVKLLSEPSTSAQQRRLARIVLASSPKAVKHVLARKLWSSLKLPGKCQVASVLASAKGVGPLDLQKADPECVDPVILLALMVKTGHTYGAPPSFLLKPGTAVPSDVATHWKSWMKDVWPKLKGKSRADRGELDVAAIQALWADSKTRADAWKRYCSVRALGLESFRALMRTPQDERDAHIQRGLSRSNPWSANLAVVRPVEPAPQR